MASNEVITLRAQPRSALFASGVYPNVEEDRPEIRGKDVEALRTYHTRAMGRFLYDPNVSMIDIGWRVDESNGSRILPELTVRVHLRKKLRDEQYQNFKAAYPERCVTKDSLGAGCVPDVIQASHQFHAFGSFGFSNTMGWAAPAPPPPNAAQFRPLRGGASGMNANGVGMFATLGGPVTDRRTGAKMILSNFHVLAGSFFAQPGLATLQPSPYDGGTGANAVARLSRHAMEQSIDAAVAELLNGVDFPNDQIGLGPVAGLASPDVDMDVTKSGRMTQVTKGTISGVEGVTLANYAGGPRQIKHIVNIIPPLGLMASAGGDSGSWWLDQGTNNAVALHFAGGTDGSALAISMPEVLDALGVDLAL